MELLKYGKRTNFIYLNSDSENNPVNLLLVKYISKGNMGKGGFVIWFYYEQANQAIQWKFETEEIRDRIYKSILESL